MTEKKILRTTEHNGLAFWCPGCEEVHRIEVPPWTFNGNFDKPTLSPSILVTGTQMITDEEADRIMAGEKIEPRPKRCHSYVTNGEIQFLGDCLHSLVNRTVPLEPF